MQCKHDLNRLWWTLHACLSVGYSDVSWSWFFFRNTNTDRLVHKLGIVPALNGSNLYNVKVAYNKAVFTLHSRISSHLRWTEVNLTGHVSLSSQIQFIYDEMRWDEINDVNGPGGIDLHDLNRLWWTLHACLSVGYSDVSWSWFFSKYKYWPFSPQTRYRSSSKTARTCTTLT